MDTPRHRNNESETGSQDPVVLSVVIPAFNEERRIEECLTRLAETLPTLGMPYEVVIVADGCKDRTIDLAKLRAKDFPRLSIVGEGPRLGKGGGVKAGVRASQGTIVLFTDTDLSVPPRYFSILVEAVRTDATDLAAASRYCPGGRVDRGQAPLRRFAGDCFRMLTSKILVRGIYDTQCGCKAFSKGKLWPVVSSVKTNSPLFDLELMMVASRAGFRITEHPVQWTHDFDSRLQYSLAGMIKLGVELGRVILRGLRRPRLFRSPQ